MLLYVLHVYYTYVMGMFFFICIINHTLESTIKVVMGTLNCTSMASSSSCKLLACYRAIVTQKRFSNHI